MGGCTTLREMEGIEQKDEFSRGHMVSLGHYDMFVFNRDIPQIGYVELG